MLIQVGAELDARNCDGSTPRNNAFKNNKPFAAELLLAKGAKMSNVRAQIPDRMRFIVTKRQNVKRGLLVFIGVLRKRFSVSGGGTEYTQGRLPRDVVGLLGRCVWSTRLDERWATAILETASRCNLQ